MAKAKQRVRGERQVDVIESYQHIFRGPHGEQVLYDLMQTHWILRSTMIGAKDQFEQTFREGERNAILRILTILKVDPKQLRERIEANAQDMVE